MFNAIDSTSENKGPNYNNNLWYCLYFMIFIFISSMLLVKLFLGFIYIKFNDSINN